MCFLITSFAYPEPITTGETAELTIRLVSVAARSSENVQEQVPRLTVDGEEISLRVWSWQKARGAIGIDCSFTLADIADRSRITAGASVTFEAGTVIDGVTEWDTIASLQKLSDRSFQVSGDSFSFRSVSGVADKLNTAPVRPFIMYDPAKAPFDAAAIDKLYDSEGREYPVEAIEFPGLTLYDIFEEVFNRCGFDGYDPNGIANHPVSQFAVDITSTFLDELNALIEPYGSPTSDGPLLTEENNVLSIHDMSQYIPEGFPAPRDLTIFGCEELSIDASYSDVVAAKMVFSVPDTFDFATSRLFVSSGPIGNDAESGAILHRLLVTNTYELRSYFQPDIIMDEREQFYWEYITSGVLDMSQEVVQHYYDAFARLHTTWSRRWSRTPANDGTFLFFGTDPHEEEFQHTFYAQHPHRIGRQYQSSIQRQIKGQIMVDSDNPYFGQPFKQDLRLAHWAGNANEGFTTETGPLRTYQESVKPLRNGQVERRILDHDHVRGVPLTRRNESQVGDVSLNGSNSRSREMLITEDGSEYTGGRVIPIHVGPIPLQYAVPLVRRKLKQMRTLSQAATLNIIGYDRTIKAGVTFAASDKLEQVEGNFVCLAYSGSGEVADDGSVSWSMTVEGTEI